MFGRDEVDVMHVSFLLELDIPFGKFLGCEIESIALVSNVLDTSLVSTLQDNRNVYNIHDFDKTHSEGYTPRKTQIHYRGTPEYRVLPHDAARSH